MSLEDRIGPTVQKGGHCEDGGNGQGEASTSPGLPIIARNPLEAGREAWNKVSLQSPQEEVTLQKP